MIYEETCQLGFKSNQNHDFMFYSDYNEAHHNQSANENSDEDSSSHYQKENQYLNQNQSTELHNLVSNAALQMNYDKKVKFADQLAFKIDQPHLFKAEEPIPIEFKNNMKPGLPQPKSKGKKGKKSKQNNSFVPPYMKKRPQSAQKKAKPLPSASDWNQDTRPDKYFDINIDPKAKRQQEKEQNERIQKKQLSVNQTSIVVDKKYDEGKLEIGFLKKNGQVGSKFEIYKDIDHLVDNKQMNYAATGYSIKNVMKQVSPPKKRLVSTVSQNQISQGKTGKIMIAQSEEEFDSKNTSTQLLNARSQQLGYQFPGTDFIAQAGDVDIKMQQLIAQTLQSKEQMIKALEDELNNEKQRREEISSTFKKQLKDFEDERDAIEKIRNASNQLEKKQKIESFSKQSNREGNESELDMIPTKEKPAGKTSQSARSIQSSNRAKKSSKQSEMSYRPDRVKSSIPKVVTESKQSKKTNQSNNNYLEQLKQQEVERAFKMRDDEIIQTQIIKKLQDHPNQHLNELQNEVALLNRKVEPLLKRVEAAANNIKIAGGSAKHKQLPGSLGMLSKMGGRMINFYADDITELLLEDFLLETALELQRLEQNQLKDYSNEEAKFLAQNLLKTLVDYQNDEQLAKLKLVDPKGEKSLHKAYNLSKLQRQDPQPLMFNLNEDLNHHFDHDESNEFQLQQNNQSAKYQYQNPFNQKTASHKAGPVDAFSKKIAELSGTAPDVSYNMMTKIEDKNKRAQHIDSNLNGITIQGISDPNIPIQRKYKIEMKEETINNIVLQREKFEKFLKMHNNTANKDVWKIYDHISDDIFHEIYAQAIKEVSKDMEEYIEKVIYDEFQL